MTDQLEQAVEVMATIEQLRARAQARNEAPPLKYTCAETGLTFSFRRLTGLDMTKIQSWSQGDEDRYSQIMAEQASVEPKINLAMWAAMGELSPMVRAGVLLFIREISGISDDALQVAKLASRLAQA